MSDPQKNSEYWFKIPADRRAYTGRTSCGLLLIIILVANISFFSWNTRQIKTHQTEDSFSMILGTNGDLHITFWTVAYLLLTVSTIYACSKIIMAITKDHDGQIKMRSKMTREERREARVLYLLILFLVSFFILKASILAVICIVSIWIPGFGGMPI